MNSLTRLIAVTTLASSPFAADAAAVRVQNANLDKGINTVFVKGVTDAVLPGTPVYLYNAETGALMGSDLDGNKQVSFRVAFPQGQRAPCTVVIRAGAPGDLDAVTAVAQVRHTTGCTAQLLQLRGQVTDAPIPNATVTVTLNGVTYTTVADANGFYTLDIATATVSELVTIEATKRMTSGETIDFVSLAGSFSKLLANAGGGVLSSDTSQKVNVTNVSTAEYVLLVEANGGTAPTTVEELQQAETRVDATELIQLAAVIKLIVDDPNYSLPSGYSTILQFIQQPAAVDAFVATVPPATLQATITAILADNGLVAGFQVNEVPARYYVTFPAEPGFLSRGGDVYEFNALRPNDCAGIGSGCTGTYLTRDVNGTPLSVPVEWYIEAGTLEMAVMAPTALSRIADPANFMKDFPNAKMTDGTLLADCNPAGTLFFTEAIVGYAFTRFNDGQTVDSLSRRSDLSYSNFLPVQCANGSAKTPANFVARLTGNILARDSGSIAPRRFVLSGAFTGAADEIVADGQWALQVYADILLALFDNNGVPYTVRARSIFADNVRLRADGTAMSDIASELGGGPSSWTVDTVTGELVINYADGWVQRVVITDAQDGNGDGTIDEYGAFSFFSGPGGVRFASSDPAFRRDTSLSIDANIVQSPSGKYWQSVVNAWTPTAWEDVPGSTTGERRLIMNSQIFGFRAAPVTAGFNGQFRVFAGGDTCGTTQRWRRFGLSGYELDEVGTLNVLAMSYITFIGEPTRTRSWSILSADTVALPTVPAPQRRLNVIEVERFEGLAGSPHRFPPRVNFYREINEPSIDRGLCNSGFQGFVPAY